MTASLDLKIENLGACTQASPINSAHWVSDDEGLLFDPTLKGCASCEKGKQPLAFECAGPRKQIFFQPAKVRVGIVTCGGLCPGLNDVIRGLVFELHYRYGVQSILGFRYGYRGLLKDAVVPPLELTPEFVEDIHLEAGTILGSSRGAQDVSDTVDNLETLGLDMLFCVGGDGTLRGALDLHNEARRRNLELVVVGVPKTIDNDISYIEKTFGFETAVSMAAMAIRSAHVEAEGAPNGIGLVKLMGRHSGFIAAQATLAMSDVNFTLLPEVPFELQGPNGLLTALEQRLKQRGHAVVVVAEGAGQDLIASAKASSKDASGNTKLKDIGLFLKDVIKKHFAKIEMEANLKYIDPSYIIRAAPATADDSVFASRLARNAVHGAMAGKSGFLVGLWNGTFTHVPIQVATSKRKRLDPSGDLWSCVLETTGQPASLVNPGPTAHE